MNDEGEFMNILFYILATILFICFAIKSWIVYKETNKKIAFAELVGSAIASIGGVILVISFLCS